MSGLILLNDIANLESDYEIESVDLVQEYWQPEAEGEAKRMVFWDIQTRQCQDQSGNKIELECAIFIVPDGEGHKSIANGSKQLVGVFESQEVKQGTPVQITYKGRKKNRTNQNSSDHWSVVTLKKKGGK